MFEVCGRRVRILTGTKSQTVNVCTEAGLAGNYEYIIRLRPPSQSLDRLFTRRYVSVQEFVAHVLDRYKGELEKGTRPRQTGRQTPVPTLPPSNSSGDASQTSLPAGFLSSWASAARTATERAIDRLVLEFVQHPYYHRVEHSIHCRLFELMAGQPELQAVLPFGRWSTQPIHKEWPEYVPRPEKENRRGNFDLVVLSPERVRGASLEAFRLGRICPTLVVEMGLAYRYDHLSEDVRKLKNSGIRDSYIVHLARQDVTDDFGAVERLLLECGLKSAYVHHMGSRVRYKLVGDAEIRDASA